MKVTIELVLDGLDDFGMAMPQVTNSDAGDQIEVSASIRSIQVRTFCAFDGQQKRRRCSLSQVIEKRFATEIQGLFFAKSIKKQTATYSGRQKMKLN